MRKPWLQSVVEALESHEYMAGVERTVDRVKETAEVFTPESLVVEMLDYLDPDLFAPGRTVLDPACGDGQFLVAAKVMKMECHGMTAKDALADLYGVDIMRDNVDLCKQRLGGGCIVMGDTLNPARQLEGQTPQELALMIQLFEQSAGGAKKIQRKPRLKKPHVDLDEMTGDDVESPEQTLF